MNNTIFILTLCLFFGACNSLKEIETGSDEPCKTPATIKDFSGLDGCRFLIVLENGDKLLPAKLSDESFTFSDNQKVLFDYVPLEDHMSICMAEKMTVEVTCIQNAGTATCLPVEQAEETDWIKKRINQHNPDEIIRFAGQDKSWVYHFKNKTNSYLYSCLDELICEAKSGFISPCIDNHSSGPGKVIWKRFE